MTASVTTAEPSTEDLEVYGDLAGTVMRLAREIRMREYHSADEIVVLPASNVQVMQYVDANPGASPSEVAEATGLQRTNTSTAIRQLEKIGFIERRPDPSDGRGVQLFSTDKALANVAAVRRAWGTALRDVLGTPDGVPEATAMLGRLAGELAADRRRTGLTGSLS